MPTAVTQGRKSTICLVLELQGRSQLETLYGGQAEVLLSQPMTKVFMRTSEPDAAHWISRSIGEIEIMRLEETHTQNIPHFFEWLRRSKSQHWQRRTKPLVMASTMSPVQATDGNFYGTARFGGAYTGGTVFKIAGSTLTALYSFCAQTHCDDGESPDGLLQASDGNFYGTTNLSGANGYGTVFKITPEGTLTTLYSFCAQTGCTDGEYPFYGGLVQASDGNFYGTTSQGGAYSACGPYGCGTIFKITPTGRLTTLAELRRH